MVPMPVEGMIPQPTKSFLQVPEAPRYRPSAAAISRRPYLEGLDHEHSRCLDHRRTDRHRARRRRRERRGPRSDGHRHADPFHAHAGEQDGSGDGCSDGSPRPLGGGCHARSSSSRRTRLHSSLAMSSTSTAARPPADPSKGIGPMSTTKAKRTNNGTIEDLDVIVVGAGFAGLYLLDRLRSAGMAVQVFEAGGGLGGVWYWNCYPGARVDFPGPIYQYSRDDLWRNWQFSELYPSWQELRDYFRYVDEKLDLSRDIRFRQARERGGVRAGAQSLDCPFERWLSREGALFRALHRPQCEALRTGPAGPERFRRRAPSHRAVAAARPRPGRQARRGHRYGGKRRADGPGSRRRGGSPHGLPAHAQYGVTDAAEEARRGRNSPDEGKVSGDVRQAHEDLRRVRLRCPCEVCA